MTECEVGRKFGNLIVVAEAPRFGNNKYYRYYWCLCKCGVYKAIGRRQLMAGKNKTCGECLSLEGAKKHMRTETPEYVCWQHLLSRCYNKNNRKYKNYGARGIIVCDRWQGEDGFINFLADMGERPSNKHSINRIDNDKNYEPSNCHWGTGREQSRNKTTSRKIEFEGKTQCLIDWAEELNMNVTTLWCRLENYGWSVEKALTTPVTSRKFKSE